MQLVITMAGRGNRFKQAGIDTPKYKLLIDGRTMFNYALSSLEAFFNDSFVFITQEANDDARFIKAECADLGIGDYEIIEISGMTDGQATTAIQADEFLSNEEEVGIYNIDTYIEEGTLSAEDVRGDGWIPTFTTPGEKWSFVELDSSETVTAVAEKERISDRATVGFYHFGSWDLFKQAYEEYGEVVESEYGETYICPLYNWLIEKNYTIHSTEIDSSAVHVLGTPEDVVDFFAPFARLHGLDN